MHFFRSLSLFASDFHPTSLEIRLVFQGRKTKSKSGKIEVGVLSPLPSFHVPEINKHKHLEFSFRFLGICSFVVLLVVSLTVY